MSEVLRASSAEDKNEILNYLCSRGQIVQQIDMFDNLWNELLQEPSQSTWLRTLRIDLRRLRSALILVQPLLPPERTHWFAFLKHTATALGEIRDYDVALRDCEKYEAMMVDDTEARTKVETSLGVTAALNLTLLKQLLQQKRLEQACKWQQQATTGWIATGLKELKECLSEQIAISDINKDKAELVFHKRLQAWERKLCQRLSTLNLDTPYDEMHQTRIKVKRFRYAYDVYMNDNCDDELLGRLKAMQDVLGSIHDGEHNITKMQELVIAQTNTEVVQEFQCFKAWREEKIQLRLNVLMDTRDQLLQHMSSLCAQPEINC